MESIKFSDILRITNGKSDYVGDFAVTGVETDSRRIKPGDIFVAIVGARVDGHSFIADVAQKGAVAAFVSRPVEDSPIPTILVESTEEALIVLAKEYFSIMSPFTVAVTGSCGKTSTKDMLFEIFSQKGNTLKTNGNYNSTVGLPLTVCRLSSHNKQAVLEMGTGHKGEIATMCRVVQPDIAVITNIGTSHMEFFESQENIYKEKTDLFRAVKPGGTLIVNIDDEYLARVMDDDSFDANKISYGIENDADVAAANIEMFNRPEGIFTEFDICVKNTDKFNLANKGLRIHAVMNSLGVHNVYNALAATAAGLAADIPLTKIVAGLKCFVADDMRLNVTRCKDGLTVISDVYNSNPQAVAAALKAMSQVAKGRKIVILGDMLELGAAAKQAHSEIGKLAAQHASFIITRGKMAIYTAGGAAELISYKNIQTVSSNKEAIEFLQGFDLSPEDTVLVKGSRGMMMEEIVDYLINKRFE